MEKKETWTWFMELLIEDLGGQEVCQSITFMSDQQKVNFSTDLINILKCLHYGHGLIYFILAYDKDLCLLYKSYYLEQNKDSACAICMPILGKNLVGSN